MSRQRIKQETQIAIWPMTKSTALLITKEIKIGIIRYFSPTRLANMKKNYYPTLSRGVGNGPSPYLADKRALYFLHQKPLERASFDSTIPFPEISPSNMQRYVYRNIYHSSAYDSKQLETSLSTERLSSVDEGQPCQQWNTAHSLRQWCVSVYADAHNILLSGRNR